MKFELSLRPRLEQRLVLAPQIIQSIEILQLPLLALRERIEQEQLENPLLEIGEEERLAPQTRERGLDEREAKTTDTENFSKLDNITEDYHEYFSQSGPQRPAASDDDGDDKMEAIQNTPAHAGTLREFLLEQLSLVEVKPAAREVAENIIQNLDRDGRLPCSLEEILASMNTPPPFADAEQALRVIQSFDPKGIGARNLQECLLLQLDKDDPDFKLHELLINNHLLDIENNRFPKIAKDTGADIEAVKRAIAYVCSLHPAPGRLYDNEVIPYVVPDAIVSLVDGEYIVSLDESNIPRLRVSQMYREMLKGSERNSDAREYLRKKIESARWLIDSIEQRRNTLLKVSREIARAQRAFFEEGISALKPLKMQEVADATGMHVATVSRAVRLKYIQTPRGIFPMKFFFTGGMTSGDGEVQSWDAVKQRIKEIVDAEDKNKPLSDEDIAGKLQAEGNLNIDIARRTVTKYRKALNIPSSRQRRQF